MSVGTESATILPSRMGVRSAYSNPTYPSAGRTVFFDVAEVPRHQFGDRQGRIGAGGGPVGGQPFGDEPAVALVGFGGVVATQGIALADNGHLGIVAISNIGRGL